ncbi:pyruvate dehydrogenase kinase [Pseudohyphozyma bogoriensis]|nr:pyruvate dehydrogenase kinase [Pseudohyphozyma bogoriensis]
MKEVYEMYWEAFESVAEASPVQLPPSALDLFMTRMLRSRISRRVITEQHIALTSQYQDKGKGKAGADEDHKVGVVDTKLNAADVVRNCAELLQALGGPEGTVPIEIDGALSTSFAYVSEHLDFMLFEILKSAANMTVENWGAEAPKHPIQVTIVDQPKELLIRVSDEGGGHPPWGGLGPIEDPLSGLVTFTGPMLVAPRLEVFSFSHMRRVYLHHKAQEVARPSDAPRQPEMGINALRNLRMAGTVQEQLEAYSRPAAEGAGAAKEEAALMMDAQTKSGIGLPLAKMYVEYWGGTLGINTVMGSGSDYLLTVKKFGVEGL